MQLMKCGQTLKSIPPDMLYYSHVNEDSQVERELLNKNQNPVAVAVAGSGERVLALMDNDSLKTMLAVDVNEEALHLLQLKIVMLENLSTEDYLRFIGHNDKAEAGFREKCFNEVRSQLTPSCMSYWDGKSNWIKKGILNTGHFEAFLGTIRPVLILFLGKKFLRILSSPDFHLTILQQLKWSMLTWIFAQQWVYKILGNKDIAFTGKGASLQRIPSALDSLIKSGQAPSSFITHLIFNGHLRDMDDQHLPPSLQKAFLERIRERLIKKELCIRYHHEDLLRFVKNHNDLRKTSTFYSVSDILSFESHSYLSELLNNSLSSAGNVIIVRGFLRNRLSQPHLNDLSMTYKSIQNFDESESSGMYQVIAIKM
jgi:S-adenosylmethionine:diacylglycerol 3-amino-3-carboxypropyl transferase